MKHSPRQILVICTRRIGDVLLTTPLIRSIKLTWPQAMIDVLVFKGTEGIIIHNPDIREVFTLRERPQLIKDLRFLIKIFRRYDLAISSLPGDRPIFYAYMAGRYRVGMLKPSSQNPFWKKWLLSQSVQFDNDNTHTVLMNLKLAQLLQLKIASDVVVSWATDDQNQVQKLLNFDIENKPFAVLHTTPKFTYKMWHQQGWISVARWLQEQGIHIVFTGSQQPSEMAYINEIIPHLYDPVLNLAGQLSLGQLGFLLSRARTFVGPDTVVTHMAAALGISTIALFGPSNPIKWGPWPKNWQSINPFVLQGSQQKNNVYLIQGRGNCVPCMQEGCDRHVNSRSDCLQELAAADVIAAIDFFQNCGVDQSL
jgi:heptosyltransferase-3